jgi:hypothetical protein
MFDIYLYGIEHSSNSHYTLLFSRKRQTNPEAFMNSEDHVAQEMGVLGRIVSIFVSPTETFRSLDLKPTWLTPYIILILAVTAAQFLTLDIQISDRLALMETQDIPPERMEAAQTQMQGPLKYIGIVIMPIVMPVVWVVLGGILLLTANMMIGQTEAVNFKKIFSLIAWSSLVSVLGIILATYITLSKGTAYGVGTDLSPLIGTPPMGEPKSLLYRLVSKLDIFTIWQLVLWTLGLSVVYKVTVKKAAVPVITLWIIWVAVSVTFGGMFERFGL